MDDINKKIQVINEFKFFNDFIYLNKRELTIDGINWFWMVIVKRSKTLINCWWLWFCDCKRIVSIQDNIKLNTLAYNSLIIYIRLKYFMIIDILFIERKSNAIFNFYFWTLHYSSKEIDILWTRNKYINIVAMPQLLHVKKV